MVDDQLIVDYNAVKLTVNKVSGECDPLSKEEREALAAFLVEHGKESTEYVCLYFYLFFYLTNTFHSANLLGGCLILVQVGPIFVQR